MSLKSLRQKIRANRRRAELAEESSVATQGQADEAAERVHRSPAEPPAPGVPPEIRAAHPALAASLEALDPWQLSAVFNEAPSTLVKAQVGSGKTTTLTHKIAYEHLVNGVPLADFVVLTFTNKAADEFRARVAALVSRAGSRPDDQDLAGFGTFHAQARRLLSQRLPIERSGRTSEFQVIDAEQELARWRSLALEHQLEIRHSRQLDKRIRLLRLGQTRFGNMRADDDITQLAGLADEAHLAANQVTFDELIALCTSLLEHCDWRPSWLLVDELQDCDEAQLAMIEALTGPQTRRLCVGDPNQVIYSWRGSQAKIFSALTNPETAVVALPINYRSSATIVDCARSFLHLSGHIEADAIETSDLVADRAGGAPVDIVVNHDPRGEAAWVVEAISSLQRGGRALDQVGVLARTRRGLEPICEALKAAGLPFVTSGKGASGDVSPWLSQLLRGLQGDAQATLEALCHRKFGVLRPKDRLEIWQTCGTSARDGMHAWLSAWLRTRKRDRKGEDTALAGSVCAGLDALSSDATVTVESLLQHLHISTLLRPTTVGHQERLDAATRACEAVVSASSWSAGLSQLALSSPTDKVAEGAVSVLTLHASKGLEWDTVLIVGCNDGALPLPGALRSPAQLMEERRLFFVGMTRARDRLALSWTKNPQDPRAQGAPCPFLTLLPEDIVQRHDHPAELFSPALESALDLPEESQQTQHRETQSGGWQAGQLVSHPKYGPGVVVEVVGGQVRCEFESHGSKAFMAALCPLRSREA